VPPVFTVSCCEAGALPPATAVKFRVGVVTVADGQPVHTPEALPPFSMPISVTSPSYVLPDPGVYDPLLAELRMLAPFGKASGIGAGRVPAGIAPVA
jgi:hypothetical protein